MNRALERYVNNLFKFRIRCESEIRNKSLQKGFTEEDIEELLQKMKEIDLINDFRFAKMYYEDNINLKQKSIKKISYELAVLGLSKEIIEKARSDLEEESSDMETLRKLRLKEKKDLDEKWIKKMISKGFEYNQIKEIIKEQKN